jgi:hypothetical protein
MRARDIRHPESAEDARHLQMLAGKMLRDAVIYVEARDLRAAVGCARSAWAYARRARERAT